MVTASHNPPQDNGYKVYLGDGSQIVPPADAEIAAADRRASAAVADVPRADDGWETLGDERARALPRRRPPRVVDPARPARPRRRPHPAARRRARRRCVARLRRRRASPRRTSSRARRSRTPTSRPSPSPTPRSRAPWTPRWRWPREVGRRPRHRQRPRRRPVRRRRARPGRRRRLADAARRRGRRAARGAHRCARGRRRGRASSPTRSSSSRLLAAMAAAAGVRHEETLTGFKWIAPGAGPALRLRGGARLLRRPAHVRDKDGVSAALLRRRDGRGPARREGRTLLDVLDDLAVAHGRARHRPALGAGRRPVADRRR